MSTNIRQPIVSVLGHVDHGKTSILDFIRKSSVMSREAGAITQHIGATEVPLDVIYGLCGPMVQPGSLQIPGLLFIDTPGHHSFTSLRSRGGALADIAVLVIDAREGFKPQTIESIHILRRLKTPFVVAANKIDLIPGWKSRRIPFAMNRKKQSDEASAVLDEHVYRLVGQLQEHGYPADRYDRITDYSRTLGILPLSAKTGEGISDLLMLLIGMAQKFLGKRLEVCGRRVMVRRSGKRDVEREIEQLAHEDLMEEDETEEPDVCLAEERESAAPDYVVAGVGKGTGEGKSGESVEEREREIEEEKTGETREESQEEDKEEPAGETRERTEGEATGEEVEDSLEEEATTHDSDDDDSDDEALETEEDGEAIYEDEPAHATVLEVKTVKGLGTTLDTIVYRGTIKYNDRIVVGAVEPIVTRIKALLKPKPLDEIRDPRQKFDKVKSVSAAAGVKIAAPDLEGVISGSPIRVVPSDHPEDLELVIEEIRKESTPNVEVDMEGIVIKADAIGSLEALASELKTEGIGPAKECRESVPVKVARIGDISRRDVIEAATMPEVMHRVILGFNVNILPDAKDEIETSQVRVITGDIIYSLLDDYEEWAKKERQCLEDESRMQIVYPGKVLVLGEHIYHVSKPAVFGIRILAGRIRPGLRFLRRDGKVVGVIRSIRSGDETLREARAGEEVALAVEGVTMGRQIKGDYVLYTSIPENHARDLQAIQLQHDEQETLTEIIQIKRKENKFWGMRR